jgi:hypothetical protein
MNQFINNRYVQLSSLVLGIGILFYLIIWVIFTALGVAVPWFVPFIMSFGSSTFLVWKYLAYKIG